MPPLRTVSSTMSPGTGASGWPFPRRRVPAQNRAKYTVYAIEPSGSMLVGDVMIKAFSCFFQYWVSGRTAICHNIP